VTKIKYSPHGIAVTAGAGKETGRVAELLNQYQETFSNSIAALIPSNKGCSTPTSSSHEYDLKIILSIENPQLVDLTLSTDESYSLTTTVDHNSQIVLASIQSLTYFGARHGLETLSQLIVWDDLVRSLIIASDYQIALDEPVFPYRGVMLDLSRHFLPVDVIRRTIRAMSFNKMNVLHLHLSDTASFPLEITNQPNLTRYGAYSDTELISHSEAREIDFYAKAHGVIVLPEVDTPAHVSAGWQWGPDALLDELILCSDPDGTGGTQWASDALEPPSGQLNLANEKIYPILGDIYSDLSRTFASSSGMLHLGGDEVIVGSDEDWAACYNSSSLGQPILQLLTDLNLSRQDPESFYLLWQNFTKVITGLAVAALSEIDPDLIPSFHFWGGAGESSVTYNLINRPDVTSTLPPELFTIQVWDDSSDSITKTLLEKGYGIVLSNTDYVYLDCGNAGWSNAGGYWCQPYHEWYHIYEYITDVIQKWDLTDAHLEKVCLLLCSLLHSLPLPCLDQRERDPALGRDDRPHEY
jgi:hexosaminidase